MVRNFVGGFPEPRAQMEKKATEALSQGERDRREWKWERMKEWVRE